MVISLDKWVSSGQPAEVYESHPKFVSFLVQSKILSQIKISKDQVRKSGEEAEILVEGEWKTEADLKRRFALVYSNRYKQTLVVERATSEVFTYLGNGNGLQQHHPFESINQPISCLSLEEYESTLDMAKRFIRPEERNLTKNVRAGNNEQRPFILQIVNSYMNKGSSHFDQFIRSPIHVFLRIIVGENDPDALNVKRGDVYEVGYLHKGLSAFPLSTNQGRFCSPDPWEYKTADERIVTNIALSKEESSQIRDFILRYHRNANHLGNQPAFHFLSQNCTVFVREACAAGGIQIPTQITFHDTLKKITPDWISVVGREFLRAASFSSSCIQVITPECVCIALQSVWERVCLIASQILSMSAALVFTPVRALFGECFGGGGVAFDQDEEFEKRLQAPLVNWKSWFSLPKLNLPSIVLEWQKQQDSTVTYQRPLQLAIAPY